MYSHAYVYKSINVYSIIKIGSKGRTILALFNEKKKHLRHTGIGSKFPHLFSRQHYFNKTDSK
jgi:hypothetical protein